MFLQGLPLRLTRLTAARACFTARNLSRLLEQNVEAASSRQSRLAYGRRRAVGGLAVALLSRTWRAASPEMSAWARAYGVKWFMVGTGVELLIGFWFLTTLPREIRDMFMGGDGLSTGLLVAALALAVLAMAVASKSLAASSVAMVGTISLMSVMRHLLRAAYLRPYFDPRALPVEEQWFVFELFALLLVGGLATVAWMLYAFFRPPAASAEAVEERRAA